MSESSLITLSASKIKVFSACPKQFYYSYVDKRESPKTTALILGTAVHRSIEKYYKEDANPLDVFIDTWNKEHEENNLLPDTREYGCGIKMVTGYDYEKRRPVENELEFIIPFPSPNNALCQIRGFIDQVYENGFIDLKTGKFQPKQGVLNNDPQFIVYAQAFKQLMGYDPEVVYWHHLRTSKDIFADVISEEKIDNVTRLVERILDAEITGIYDKNIGMVCSYCSYREPCLGRSD